MKKLVVISDLHCGHLVGLCPPKYQSSDKKIRAYQAKAWRKYLDLVKANINPDVLLVNGDAIDGSGKRGGGRGLWSTDLAEQCDAAEICIKKWGAKKVIMTHGTPYHTGQEVDFENFIAKNVGAEIFSRAKFSINGLTFDARHTIGSSQIPHGRFTALARENYWNKLWTSEKGLEQVDVVIRSHVHYYGFVGGSNFLGITTPALQLGGSAYGMKMCSGLVDWGLVVFEIDDKGGYSWKAEISKVQFQKEKVLEL